MTIINAEEKAYLREYKTSLEILDHTHFRVTNKETGAIYDLHTDEQTGALHCACKGFSFTGYCYHCAVAATPARIMFESRGRLQKELLAYFRKVMRDDLSSNEFYAMRKAIQLAPCDLPSSLAEDMERAVLTPRSVGKVEKVGPIQI